MNKLLTTIAAVVLAASAGIAGAQAPGKGGDMKAAPGSPAAGTQTVPSPAASPEAGPKKGSPTADAPAPKKAKKAKKTKSTKKSSKPKKDDSMAPAPAPAPAPATK
jgi:hypothetical protein